MKEEPDVFSAPDNGARESFSAGPPVFYYAGEPELWLQKQNLNKPFPSS